MVKSIIYIISQILVVIYCLIYSSTFMLDDESDILKRGILAIAVSAISYLLLGAYTGVAMCIIAIIRNFIFSKSKSFDCLIIIYAVIIFASVISYQNVYSLLNISATMIYTYALWQNSVKRYKFCGIIVNTLMIMYDISIMSFVGAVFMVVAVISSIVGYVKGRELAHAIVHK